MAALLRLSPAGFLAGLQSADAAAAAEVRGRLDAMRSLLMNALVGPLHVELRAPGASVFTLRGFPEAQPAAPEAALAAGWALLERLKRNGAQ